MGACGGGGGRNPARSAGRPEFGAGIPGKNSGKKFGEKIFDKYHSRCDSFDRFSLEE